MMSNSLLTYRQAIINVVQELSEECVFPLGLR